LNYLKEAEKYLKHYHDLHRSLQNMRGELSRLYGKAAPKGYSEVSTDIIKLTSRETSYEDDTYNLLFRIKTLTENISRTEEQLQEIDEILDSISQDEGCELYGDILRKMYIERLPREEIAQDMRYSERNIYYLKHEALAKFAVNLFGIDALGFVR